MMGGILMLVTSIIISIAGFFFDGWYKWLLIIVGIILAIIGLVMLIMEPEAGMEASIEEDGEPAEEEDDE